MSRARELAKLGNTDALGIDGVDLRAGSVSKGTNLDVATDVKVVGVVTATNFFGEGSGLTGLAAVGAGVTVMRENNSIGAATKINFDGTFGVSALASGITTITSGVTTADPRSASLVVIGVSTLGNVNAGILTANQLSGPLTGTAVTVTSVSASGNSNFNNASITNITGGTTVVGVVTATTIASNNITGSAQITQLSVSGIATAAGQLNLSNTNVISGILTAGGQVNLSNTNVTSGILTVGGQTTLTNLNVGVAATLTELNIGIGGAEITGFTTITNGGVSAVGMVTAFAGFKTPTGTLTFAKLDGGDATQEISFNRGLGLKVSGQSSYTGIATFATINISGIITASGHVDQGVTTYYGDGSYTASMRWVLTADGSSNYIFTGPGFGHSTATDPTLYLKRGHTYMFENKMGAHPFRIQSTTNGAAGTAWNVGVTNNDVANGVLIFEVPFVTPDTLYYQCTAHAAMGGVINIT